MTWRDRLESASFRGVPFYVDSSTAQKQRRVPMHKLAGKDGSVNQDLGRDPDQFDVTAFLFGDDYDLERDDLEAALMEPGAAALVLPTRGELWVRISGGLQTSESKDQGGYCTIRFTCVVEDRDAGTLKKFKNAANALRKASSLLKAAATVDFAQHFDVLSTPGRYLKSVTNAVSNVSSNMRRISGKIAAGTNGLSDIDAALTDLDSAVDELIYAPQKLANELQAITRSVVALADHTQDSINRTTGLPSSIASSSFALSESVRLGRQAQRSIAKLGSGAADPDAQSTPLTMQEAANVRAVYRLVRAEALASTAELYASAIFDSSTLAASALADLSSEVDALSVFSGGDDLYYALQDMRAAAADHLAITASSRPPVTSREIAVSVPALLLAHNVYGDASLEAEVTARNKPKYPLFLSGTLELLEP